MKYKGVQIRYCPLAKDHRVQKEQNVYPTNKSDKHVVMVGFSDQQLKGCPELSNTGDGDIVLFQN